MVGVRKKETKYNPNTVLVPKPCWHVDDFGVFVKTEGYRFYYRVGLKCDDLYQKFDVDSL